MSSFIREIYFSDLCGANKHFDLSEEAEEARKASKKLYESIREEFDKKELDLFDKYIEETQIVKDKEIFHAYVSGMKDFIRLIISVFDE